jgi:hypothetical protein
VSDPVGSDKKRKGLSAPVIGAIATVSAAVIAGIFTLIATTNSKSEPSTVSGTSHGGSSSSPAPATQSSSGTGATPVATRPPIYYQGPVLISGFPGLDFDINPPGPGPDAVSISYNTFALKGGSSTVGLAVWKNSATPTATDCKTLVSTQQVPFVYQPVEGMKICFQTDQGRIGLLQVMPGTSENQFKATATVWGA